MKKNFDSHDGNRTLFLSLPVERLYPETKVLFTKKLNNLKLIANIIN